MHPGNVTRTVCCTIRSSRVRRAIQQTHFLNKMRPDDWLVTPGLFRCCVQLPPLHNAIALLLDTGTHVVLPIPLLNYPRCEEY